MPVPVVVRKIRYAADMLTMKGISNLLWQLLYLSYMKNTLALLEKE